MSEEAHRSGKDNSTYLEIVQIEALAKHRKILFVLSNLFVFLGDLFLFLLKGALIHFAQVLFRCKILLERTRGMDGVVRLATSGSYQHAAYVNHQLIKTHVASFPAYFRIMPFPPGWSGRNSVTS